MIFKFTFTFFRCSHSTMSWVGLSSLRINLFISNSKNNACDFYPVFCNCYQYFEVYTMCLIFISVNGFKHLFRFLFYHHRSILKMCVYRFNKIYTLWSELLSVEFRPQNKSDFSCFKSFHGRCLFQDGCYHGGENLQATKQSFQTYQHMTSVFRPPSWFVVHMGNICSCMPNDCIVRYN